MRKNAQKRTVKRRHSAQVTYFVMELARNEHLSAGSIARSVQEKFKELEDCPSARTVQDMVREVRSRPQSGAWRPWGVDPDDAAVVLGALADLMYMSGGKTTEISREDAEWIIRLSRAGVGDLPPGTLHSLAIDYLLREAAGAATSDLDALVAFTPWRSEGAFERYSEAIEPVGWIPRPLSMALVGDYKQLLRRLHFSEETIAQAENYEEALALEGGTPRVAGTL